MRQSSDQRDRFPATPVSVVWSSTDDASIVGNAQTLHFINGFPASIFKGNALIVRLLRGGAPVDLSVAAAVPQTLSFGAAPVLNVGEIGSVNVTSSSRNSGNPIRFASSTPAVCCISVVGAVTRMASGVCTVTADRCGRVMQASTTRPPRR